LLENGPLRAEIPESRGAAADRRLAVDKNFLIDNKILACIGP
jgi:hypothetical protein